MTANLCQEWLGHEAGGLLHVFAIHLAFSTPARHRFAICLCHSSSHGRRAGAALLGTIIATLLVRECMNWLEPILHEIRTNDYSPARRLAARRAITRVLEPLPRIFVFCPDWIRGGMDGSGRARERVIFPAQRLVSFSSASALAFRITESRSTTT